MDESVISAIASAAMLNGAEKLTGDLEKIEVMTSRAAKSEAAESEKDKTAEDEFSVRMGSSGEGKTALREDKSAKFTDGYVVSQSKRYEGVYTSVPRVV